MLRPAALALIILGSTACESGSAEAAPSASGLAQARAAVGSALSPIRAHRHRRAAPGVVAGAAAGYGIAGGVPAYGFGDAGPYPGHNYRASNGRIYPYCVFDEGYGRVRPCDAGGGEN